jgi:hypothetical protein
MDEIRVKVKNISFFIAFRYFIWLGKQSSEKKHSKSEKLIQRLIPCCIESKECSEIIYYIFLIKSFVISKKALLLHPQ